MSQSQVPQTTTVSMLENDLSLRGNLLFSTISSILTVGCKMIENNKADTITIDMSEVEKIDSAGIALLLAWKRLCDSNNKKYCLKGTSQQVISLINTNKLEKILNLS
jgi:phospholipid transport system transporter-binding protein